MLHCTNIMFAKDSESDAQIVRISAVIVGLRSKLPAISWL